MVLSRRVFAFGLLAGLFLRLVSLPLPGTGDVTVWKIWAYAGARAGVLQMYGVGGAPTERRLHTYDNLSATVDYPPLSLLALAGVGHAYQSATGGFANTALLTAAVKTLPFLADVGITCLLMWGTRRILPARAGIARFAGLAYWLNPAVLMNGAVLGYLDPLAGLPLTAAVFAAWLGHPAVAGVALAAALLTKPQAVLLAPLVALAVVNRAAAGRRWRAVAAAIAGGSAAAVIVIVPFVIAGAWPNFVQSMESLGRHNTLSANAANVWWIVTYVMRAAYAVDALGWYDAFFLPVRRPLMISTILELGYPNPRALAAFAVLALTAWGVWRCRGERDEGRLAALGGWIVLSYFALGIAVHENHGYLMMPMLAVASALRPEWRPLAASLSVTMALNLNLFYGFGDRIGYALPRELTILDASVWLAIAVVVQLAMYGRRLDGGRPVT